jgi:dolichyl-phosphate beta-glucosyltransferase
MINHSICRTIVVVPCYNEASRLDAESYRGFLERNPDVGILFVDDGSTDTTNASLESLRCGFEEQTGIVRREKNSGKAEAVRAGLLEALADGQAEYVGFWDADLATPLSTIRRFIEVLDTRRGIQCVFGARVKLLGRSIQRDPVRHYLGRVFATVVSTMLGLSVYDTQCGAKLFRRDLHAILNEPFLSRWVFDVEILARLKLANSKKGVLIENVVVEYPLEAWCDVGGSKVKPRDFVTALKDIFRIYFQYRLG